MLIYVTVKHVCNKKNVNTDICYIKIESKLMKNII